MKRGDLKGVLWQEWRSRASAADGEHASFEVGTGAVPMRPSLGGEVGHYSRKLLYPHTTRFVRQQLLFVGSLCDLPRINSAL
jgi:hypothetical protein